MATLSAMQEGDEKPDTEEESELDQLGADLGTVEAALAALDADDLDEAEALTASLSDPTEAIDD